MPQIEELATSTRAPAPGWSYVIDTGPRLDPSKVAINPSGQKRRRVTVNPTPDDSSQAEISGDGAGDAVGGFGRPLTLRQQADIKRHLAELERDGGGSHKEVDINVPKSGIGAAREGKRTVNVRRILGSGKTFAHYLEEEEAAIKAGGGRIKDVDSGTGVKAVADSKSEGKKDVRASKTPYARRKSGVDSRTGSDSGSATPAPASKTGDKSTPGRTTKSAEPKKEIATNVPPAPTFAPGTILAQPVSAAISEEEIEALLSAPQLTYNEARSKPPDEVVGGMRMRHRVFCEICGYWGRAKCMKCGARICGIECRDTHDESRCLKFYA